MKGDPFCPHNNSCKAYTFRVNVGNMQMVKYIKDRGCGCLVIVAGMAMMISALY